MIGKLAKAAILLKVTEEPSFHFIETEKKGDTTSHRAWTCKQTIYTFLPEKRSAWGHF